VNSVFKSPDIIGYYSSQHFYLLSSRQWLRPFFSDILNAANNGSIMKFVTSRRLHWQPITLICQALGNSLRPETSLTGTIAISNSQSCLVSLRSTNLFKFWYLGIHRPTQPTQYEYYDSAAHIPTSSLRNSRSTKIQREINWKIINTNNVQLIFLFYKKVVTLGPKKFPDFYATRRSIAGYSGRAV
jgi:hypothetical protein